MSRACNTKGEGHAQKHCIITDNVFLHGVEVNQLNTATNVYWKIKQVESGW